MRKSVIERPIGLKSVCVEIQETCLHRQMYRRCGLRPRHLIINMDHGSGRSTLIHYMTDMYKDFGVMDFESGLDDSIEVDLDGSLAQLRQAFSIISDAAVYANEYKNIVAIDISKIAFHSSETQYTEFLENVKYLCASACVVFFTRADMSRNEEKLVNTLCDQIDNIKRLSVEPYSKEDYARMVIRNLQNRDIELKNPKTVEEVVLKIIESEVVDTVKKAINLAEQLIRYADFSGFTPVIDGNVLKVKAMELKSQERREAL